MYQIICFYVTLKGICVCQHGLLKLCKYRKNLEYEFSNPDDISDDPWNILAVYFRASQGIIIKSCFHKESSLCLPLLEAAFFSFLHFLCATHASISTDAYK